MNGSTPGGSEELGSKGYVVATPVLNSNGAAGQSGGVQNSTPPPPHEHTPLIVGSAALGTPIDAVVGRPPNAAPGEQIVTCYDGKCKLPAMSRCHRCKNAMCNNHRRLWMAKEVCIQCQSNSTEVVHVDHPPSCKILAGAGILGIVLLGLGLYKFYTFIEKIDPP